MPTLADVQVPPNEEGTRATVLKWCKRVGDAVAKDEPLVELETDKVTVEIASPASGVLIEILKQENAEVIPAEVIARLSLGGAASARAARRRIAAGRRVAGACRVTCAQALESRGAASAQGTFNGRGRHRGHGPGWAHYGARRDPPCDECRCVDITAKRAPAAVQSQAQASPAATTRVPHTAIRRRVAEHMARSLVESPHVTTLFEADLTRVLAHRSRHAADYESRGARLTLTAYFVSACAQALRAHREINATFHSDALELHADVNIGVGTALGNKGLIVPVIHRAQGLNLFGMAQRLGQLVEAARAGKLSPEDVRGGTFTISNHGVGGSLLAAPIVINQPQVAILGVGKVQRRVCAIEIDGVEAIGVRSLCYLTLTIDHRALDAFQANAFLSSVVATLEQWPADDA